MKKIILLTIACAIGTQAYSQWSLTGNAGTNATTNFIGTTDNIAFKVRTNNVVRMTVNGSGKVGIGITSPIGKLHVKGNTDVSQLMIDAGSTQTNANPLIKLRKSDGTDLMWINSDDPFNIFIGNYAGSSNSAAGGGLYNTFIGRSAGNYNTTGYSNTATGEEALAFNTTGYENTACGINSLWLNTTATQNTAIGCFALLTQSFDNGGTPWISANTAVGCDALRSNQPSSTSNGNNNTAVGHSALRSNTVGFHNTALGINALYNNIDGTENTGIGSRALQFNNNGLNNTATGASALRNNISGSYNTSTGYQSLYTNTTGSYNTAAGFRALFSNTTGGTNTATGYEALYSNTKGQFNTANGIDALHSNTTASRNVAIGRQALFTQSYSNGGNEWASNNVAIGFEALVLNQPVSTSTGIYNTAVGNATMHNNTFGYSNTAIGYAALYSNDIGIYNTAIGQGALYYNSGIADRNTAVGYSALTNNVAGDDNVAVGYGSGTGAPNLNNTVSIGNLGYLNGASNQSFIGNLSTNWVGGQTTWFTYASDARVKNNVQEDVMGLEFISKLRPVTYNLDIEKMRVITGNKETEGYPGKYDVEKIKQSGFIAQEVVKAAEETNYNFSGVTIPRNEKELYTMSYSQFVVPLVKAVQELNEELKSEVGSMKSEIENLQSEIRNLKSGEPAIQNPKSAMLFQNTPNPFNTQTEIKFQLPSTFSSAQIIINDVDGKQVRTINVHASGTVIITTGELTAGVYAYALIIDGATIASRQLIIISK